MTPTIEEVKKVAIECGLYAYNYQDEIFVQNLYELQAFAQHYIEVGRKVQRDSDEKVCMQMDGMHDALYAEAICNNTGE